MRSFLPRAALLCLMVGGCFTAQALLSSERHEPASPASVEDLTRWLAACPELAQQVGQRLDAEEGLLSQTTAGALTEQARDCARHREGLPPADRYRLAYSALKALVARGG